ncbi:MAG: DUF6117 family protein [Candidatus Thorarchaeota archaeon]|jgi:hypothetical protein
MTIVQDHQENFNTLSKAFEAGDVCIMDCIEKASGEHIAVICAVTFDGTDYQFTPFARFFNGNPYEMLESPMQYEGVE